MKTLDECHTLLTNKSHPLALDNSPCNTGYHDLNLEHGLPSGLRKTPLIISPLERGFVGIQALDMITMKNTILLSYNLCRSRSFTVFEDIVFPVLFNV
jgi:hypothetical protein